jgi:hypothetical protein
VSSDGEYRAYVIGLTGILYGRMNLLRQMTTLRSNMLGN